LKFERKRPNRRPSHLGEILKCLWLDELGYSQSDFAQLLATASGAQSTKATLQTKLNEVISGKRAMSADFAFLTSKVLNTKPRMWTTLQVQVDIWDAEQRVA
jgi:addiction module HigA family antidote